VCYSVLHCVVLFCSVVQCVAVWYNDAWIETTNDSGVLQCVVLWCIVLQCVAMWCHVVQYDAVCCTVWCNDAWFETTHGGNVLQCVVLCCMCCSVLQCGTTMRGLKQTTSRHSMVGAHVCIYICSYVCVCIFMVASYVYTCIYTVGAYLCVYKYMASCGMTCVAVCCAVLHCVAVCCAALLCVAYMTFYGITCVSFYGGADFSDFRIAGRK